MTEPIRVAVPSKGRLRDDVLALLSTTGFGVDGLRGRGSLTRAAGFEIIEMRPRDAAAALGAGALSCAFIATDIALETVRETCRPATALGASCPLRYLLSVEGVCVQQEAFWGLWWA